MNNQNELQFFRIADIPATSDFSAETLVKTYERAFATELAKLGFRNVRRASAGMPLTLWFRKPQSGSPQLLAERDGRKVSIYLGDAVDNWLNLTTMSAAAYQHAASLSESEDAYYGAMLISSEASEQNTVQLGVYGMALMRHDGRWRDGDPDSYQFLPLDKRAHHDRLTPVVGGASFIKADLIARTIAANGKPLKFHISGLCTSADMSEDYLACGVGRPPMLTILCRNRGEQHLEMECMPFYSDSDPCSELELVGLPTEEAPTQVMLMDETGREFCAECLEAALLRSSLHRGQRFLWTLSMVADRCEYNSREISITEGAFFEMEKLRYEQENGCPPPADYAITVSTGEMRMLSQGEDNDNHAVAVGKVESIEAVSLGPAELTCLRIHCLPDNENVRLNVYVSAHVLGDYAPKEGDNILCQGCLYAAPDSLVEGSSWLDSAEVGSNQQQHEDMMKAYHVYEQYDECSIGMAAAISALTEEGWEHTENLWPYANLFCARNQLGELAVFAVNTTINGREPEDPFTAERLAALKPKLDLAAGRYALHIGIDYVPQAERYTIKLLDDGGFGTSLSMPSYVGRAYAPTTLCLDDGEATHRRNYPEQLDEAEMAARFARCLTERNWEELARWLLEEMEYKSDTIGQQCNSKQSFLAYMSSRRDFWEEVGNWKDMHFSCGTVEYEGRRRPCCALWHFDKRTAITLFENGDGLVRAIRNLRPEQYPSFEENTPS